MARNTLIDLNNHLFAQLERLGAEELKPDQLEVELDRSKAIGGIARNVIDTAKITLEGMKFAYEDLDKNTAMPAQFQLKEAEVKKIPNKLKSS